MPRIDATTADATRAVLAEIRHGHAHCLEPAGNCRSAIVAATNEHCQALDARSTRRLLVEHAALVNELLEARAGGRVVGLMVIGRRLHLHTAGRFH